MRINGLARGTYEIEEQGGENYTIEMKSGPLNGAVEDEVNGIIELNKEMVPCLCTFLCTISFYF